MANATTNFGFVPVRKLGGGSLSYNTYYVPASDSTALYRGDFVILAGDCDASGQAPTVARAAASGVPIGAIIGVDQVRGIADANFSLYRCGYRPASVGMYVYVCDDPLAIYAAKEDASGATIAAGDMGANVNFVVNAGSAVTGMSGMAIASSTVNTTATLPLKLLGADQQPNNVPFSANANYLVIINNQPFKGGTGTLGV